jgi:hypothetical protein
MTSETTQKATAFVSLFQTFHFGIALGELRDLVDESVVVFIDPPADNPPNDIQEHRQNTVLCSIVRPDPIHAHHERNIRERTNERALQEVLFKIERWKFAREIQSVRVRLNAARGQPARDIVNEIIAVIEDETSRVYRLVHHVGREFMNAQQDNPIAQPILQHIERCIARDPSAPLQLTGAARAFMERCMLALANELAQRLTQREITMDDLWDIFSSGPGADIVGALLFEPFR